MVEVVRLAIPIPKGLSAKQVTGHFNPSPDGNCGYRAIAHAIFDDEASFGKVKHEMLLCLRKNEQFYRQVFGSSPSASEVLSGTFESIQSKLSNDASAGITDNWFQFPEMVQLAADTFSRAIACYTPDNQSTTLAPYFSSPFPVRPIPLQLYNSHFYIVELKPNSKPRWPRTYPGHSFNCKRHSLEDFSLIY